MPRPGRHPAPDHLRQRTNSPDEWLDVPNVPYRGRRPPFPRDRTVLTKNGLETVDWQPATRVWWDTITRLPHCALWSPGEWQVALATLVVFDNAQLGSTAAASHLLTREKQLGVTADARRQLRIRYVDPETGQVIADTGRDDTGKRAPSVGKGVVQLDDYRDL